MTKFMINKDGVTFYLNGNTCLGRRMALTESSTLSFRLPDAAAGDRRRYACMNVARPLLLAAIGPFRADLWQSLFGQERSLA